MATALATMLPRCSATEKRPSGSVLHAPRRRRTWQPRCVCVWRGGGLRPRGADRRGRSQAARRARLVLGPAAPRQRACSAESSESWSQTKKNEKKVVQMQVCPVSWQGRRLADILRRGVSRVCTRGIGESGREHTIGWRPVRGGRAQRGSDPACGVCTGSTGVVGLGQPEGGMRPPLAAGHPHSHGAHRMRVSVRVPVLSTPRRGIFQAVTVLQCGGVVVA